MFSKSVKIAATAVLLLLTTSGSVIAETACPVTKGSDYPINPRMPGSDFWFGNSQLAAVIPEDGIWPTTAEGALISVKSLWWSSEFDTTKPPTLEVTVASLDGKASDVRVSHSSFVDIYSQEGAVDNKKYLVMVGIAFPSEGCWSVTGRFSGHKLEYIVATKSSGNVT